MLRPKPDESEEDLLKQEEAFKAKLNRNEGSYPAAKVVRLSKRKTEDVENSNAEISEKAKAKVAETINGSKPKSRFSESRMKKKKEGIVDNTILKEAAARDQEKKTVLSPIVARNVPTVSPLMAHWQPPPSPNGFPHVPTLRNLKLNGITTELPTTNRTTYKRKSLYMKQMEQEMLKDSSSEIKINKNCGNANEKYLTMLGNQSYILDGSSGLGKLEEAERIHEENMSKLANLSHEERLIEREEIMSRLSEEQLKFILSLRQKKGGNKGTSVEKVSSESMLTSPTSEAEGDAEPVKRRVSPNQEECSVEMKEEGEEEEEQNLTLDELPIPPEEAKKWAHMNKIEIEKLKWMSKMPDPKPLKGKEGYVARFNFQGDLLPYNANISWREGLHHHGEEPGRPGYSLDELFLFVRSQVLQQRHLGLKTLGNILRNASEGLYDTCFEVPIIQLMVDAGLVLLLRFAIDENTALVYQQAIRTLYYLISSEPDERCLAIADPWSPLGVQPGVSSVTHSKEKDREELDAEERELKDVEVIKLDIIRALVRMDVHIRLRYFLETETLSPPDVVHIVGVLRRIARHSLSAAWTLVQTPRLMETIVNHFLPHNTTQLLRGNNVLQLTSVYGVPLSHALSLMKVLASRGRQIAVTLVEKSDLMNRIMTYVSLEPTEVQMPLVEVLSLSQEAYYLWSLFLTYNLTKAQQGFASFYPLFVRQLIFYRDKVDINDETERNHFNYEIGCQMMNVLTKGLSVAATETLLTNRMKNKEPSATRSDGKELVLQPPVLRWSDFNEIITLVEVCFLKWINQTARCSNVSFSGFKLLGSVCSFLTVYFDKWRDQKDFVGTSFVRKIEHFKDNILSLLYKEDTCNLLFKNLREHSALCSELKLGKTRDPVNLGSLWSVCEGGKVTPILRKDSTFPFILPLLTLTKTAYTLCPSLGPEPVHTLLNNFYVQKYLNDICESKHSLTSQWFTRVEIYTIANILQLASIASCDDVLLYHRTALNILPLVHEGDEHIIKSLLTDVICDVAFVKDLTDIETRVDDLAVNEFKPLKSPAIQKPVVSPLEIRQQVLETLPIIGQNMVSNLMHSKLLERSSVRNNCIPFLINDLSIDKEEESAIVNYYWSLTPLSLLLRLSEESKGKESDQTQPGTFAAVVKWVQMTYLILKYRKSFTKRRTNPMGWFRHLSNVFLASNDLFLDSNVSAFTQASLAAVLEGEGHKSLDPLWTHYSVQPCYDWYKRITEHFGSVSYGDSTFALFIIIPLLRRWPSDFKMVLFGDFPETLPFIRLTTEEVSQFIPLKEFLDPPEDNLKVINKYKLALGSSLINDKRTPFLYEFVVRHVRSFAKGTNV